MDKKLQELLDWMFFNNGIMEATKILSNQLAPVQRDSIIKELEVLKKKKEEIGRKGKMKKEKKGKKEEKLKITFSFF